MKYEYVVPWNAIAEVAEIEVVRNASVAILMTNVGAIIVTPPELTNTVLKGFANNRMLSGSDVVLMAAHFNVPAEALCAAIRNYVQNPEAPAELHARPRLD